MLNKYNLDIVALSETRFPGNGQLSEKEYTFFWSGLPDDDKRYAGVGFALRKNIVKTLEENPEAINERLMTLRIPITNKRSLLCISAYAPTMTNPDETKEKFYEELKKILLKASSCDDILLLGDFNARVGNDQHAWPGVLGKHLLGTTNSNGLLLLSLCSELKLVITNSVFQLPNQQKGTWCHPRSKHWHTMDYVITKQSGLNNVKITRAHQGTECWSDHRLVRSRIKIKIPKIPRKAKTKIPKKINCSSLQKPSLAQPFSEKLDVQVMKCNITDDIETSWKSLKDTIYTTSVDLLGFPTRKHQDWFDENDDATSKLLNNMHASHLNYMNNKKSKKAKQKYIAIENCVQTCLRKMKEMWWKTKANELQQAADTHNSKKLYQGLKAIYGPPRKQSSALLSSDGSVKLVKDEDILNRWAEHYCEVLNRQSSVNIDEIHSLPQSETILEIDHPPTAAEVKDAMKVLCRGKQPGLVGIPPDVYKEGGPQLVKQLTKLMKEIWKKGEVPQDFKDATIISLFKKGKRTVCDNYRGISLLSVAGKLLARVIINRINKHITDLVCSESQCGYRKGRGTVDMVFCLRQLQEKSREHRTPLYMAFVDLTKAFDTVSRTALWIVLEKIGIPPQMRMVIRSFHEGMMAQVNLSGKLSHAFLVSNGTKQGCVLAPILFALYFAVMLIYALKGKEFGIPVCFRATGGLFNIRRFNAPTKTSLELILDLLFADDCALVSQSCEELQEIVDCFARACTVFGLTISTKKTEIIYQKVPGNDSIQPLIKVNDIPLKVNTKFCYLGSTISEKATLDDELKVRIGKASEAFGKLQQRLWSSHDVSLATKVKVYSAVIIPALTYGCETWTPYRRQIRMLDAFHLRKLRSLCNVSWKDKVTNQEILSRCKISGIEAFLMKAQLRWTGHVIRMDNRRLPKIMLYSQLANATRPEGRPLLRYKDKLKANLASLDLKTPRWEETALQRTEWRALCNQHVTHFETERKKKMIKDRESRKRPQAPSASSLFVCNICDKICKSKAGLVSHKKSHPTTANGSTTTTSVKCRICDKVCKNEHGLKVHLRVHK